MIKVIKLHVTYSTVYPSNIGGIAYSSLYSSWFGSALAVKAPQAHLRELNWLLTSRSWLTQFTLRSREHLNLFSNKNVEGGKALWILTRCEQDARGGRGMRLRGMRRVNL